MTTKDELLKSKNINLDYIIKKEVLGIDGLDLGKVIEIGETYVVTQRGLIDKKKYFNNVLLICKFRNFFAKIGLI